MKDKVDPDKNKLNVFEEHESEKDRAIGKLLRRAIDKKVEFYRTEGTYEEFKLMGEICLSSTIASSVWKTNHPKVKLSELLTVADEALALLVLENNVEEWIEQIEKREWVKPPKKRRLTRYTGKGQKIDGTRKGWSLEGKKRYNSIFDEIVGARKEVFSVDREKDLLKDWGGAMSEMDLRVRASANVTNREEIEKEMSRIRDEESFVPRNSIGI